MYIGKRSEEFVKLIWLLWQCSGAISQDFKIGILLLERKVVSIFGVEKFSARWGIERLESRWSSEVGFFGIIFNPVEFGLWKLFRLVPHWHVYPLPFMIRWHFNYPAPSKLTKNKFLLENSYNNIGLKNSKIQSFKVGNVCQ